MPVLLFVVSIFNIHLFMMFVISFFDIKYIIYLFRYDILYKYLCKNFYISLEKRIENAIKIVN